MDILRLYRDYSVPHATDGHKHCRPGWVNTECPHCTGNQGLHLGWNIYAEYFMCWRCGWHPPVKTISMLLNINVFEASVILKHYGINKSSVKELPKDKKGFKLPSDIQDNLVHKHIKYLRSRHFNPADIVKIWKIRSAGPLALLDQISYKHRIIIPFFWNGQMVSFDSRTTNPDVEERYKACPIQREDIEHKKILYGNQEAWGSTGIIVEGPTDAWRLGEKAAAVSGIKYTPAQVRVIAQTFKRVAVVFDDDPQAVIQADKLVHTLKQRYYIDAWSVRIKGDPGSLSNGDAKVLVSNILKIAK